MRDIKRAKNFDGIQAIMTELEYNSIICGSERIIKNIENGNSKDMEWLRDELNHLLLILTKYSYFDEENREVRVRLGYRELETLTDMESLYLPTSNSEESARSFETCLKRDECKKWVNTSNRKHDNRKDKE